MNHKSYFNEEVLAAFKEYCKREKLMKTDEQFLNYLVKSELIEKKEIQQQAICFKYKELKGKYRKTDIVYQLSAFFSVHRNTIWTALKNCTE